MARTRCLFAALALAAGIAGCTGAPKPTATAAGGLDRTILPIPEPAAPSITTADARKATPPPRFEVTAPKGAPNVVVVLLDDIGFGAASAFGGPIRMPMLDSLAGQGLRYTRFHTVALCSPTRMALLTGRNHHVTNTGAIMELATAFPGNTGVRPQSVAPVAEMLRLNGYSTAAFGKYHETAPWEVSVSGPYDRWPTHSGFDKFYGFIGGETNQWSPSLYDGSIRVEPPHTPGYHLTTDLTDHAIEWMRFQHAMTPDKPFFVYFATGALHAPHHVPAEWIQKYRGQFGMGWDSLRTRILRRQLEMGVVPPGTELTARPPEIGPWDTLSAERKRLFERQMEVYAGFGEQTDHEVGRLVQALHDMQVFDNTLFIYIVGDNGASAEGGPDGTYNETLALNGIVSDVRSQLGHIDEWGGPNTFPHFAVGWAHALDTPFQWTKQVASHFGGTRNGMVVSWPARIRAHGEFRTQFHHVIDIAPTVLEAAGLPQPTSVNGAKQTPMDGVSMVYSFGDANVAGARRTQYFEMFGNRAIYHDGWVAATRHSIPWVMGQLPPFEQDRWELYDVANDFSESNDLAAKNPAKLTELKKLFEQEAIRNHVYPLDDRRSERFDPSIAGRPDLLGPRTSLTLYEGMEGINPNAFINTMRRSYTVTAEVELPGAGAHGVILSNGGRFGGFALYMKAGKAVEVYNFAGLARTSVTSGVLGPGRHTIRYEFAYDGGAPGSGGLSTLFVDEKKAGEARIDRTLPFFLSDEGVSVGHDEETPVTDDYAQGENRFSGRILSVTVATKAPPTR